MRTWKKRVLSLALAAGVVVGGTAEAMTLDEEQQLDVLSAQNQIWEQNMSIEEAVAQDGKFAVTDLDHNGRMEILFTTTIGEEEFVETWGYEVNRTGDGASLLQFLNGSNTTQIGQSDVRMYFACQILKRHYIFETVRWTPSMEGGWARDGKLVGLCLEDGVVRQEPLGHFFMTDTMSLRSKWDGRPSRSLRKRWAIKRSCGKFSRSPTRPSTKKNWTKARCTDDPKNQNSPKEAELWRTLNMGRSLSACWPA